MRETGRRENALFDRLADEPALKLSRDELQALVRQPLELSGDAAGQVERLGRRVSALVAEDPEAAAYRPGAVL